MLRQTVFCNFQQSFIFKHGGRIFSGIRVALLCVVTSGLIPVSLVQGSPALKVERALLWRGGMDGYETYQIPGIVVSFRGTVLAHGVGRHLKGR